MSPRRSAIDRSSVIPFYHQLKEILRADMAGRGLSPGDRLPGDHELCDRYDVSRTVVRQALADLEREGLIQREKGRGTFVAPGRTSQRLVQTLTGLYEDVAALGKHLRSDVRRLDVGPAEPDVAERLEIADGSPVITLERLRFVDDEPWVYAVTHVPAHLAPGLGEHDLREQSLYALLEGVYGLRLVRGRRTVEADIAGPALARDLRIRRGAAVLVLTSVVYGADQRPLEIFTAFHRADRSRFEVALERQQGERPSEPLMVIL